MPANFKALTWENPDFISRDETHKNKLQDLFTQADDILHRLTSSPDSLPPFIRHILSPQIRKHLGTWEENIGKNFQNLVVLGTGGSSRGGHAVCALKKRSDKDLRTLFFENIGPHSMDKALADLDPHQTHFLVISKSGSTAETLAQCIVCIRTFVERGLTDTLSDHFTLIMDQGDSPLRKLADKYQLEILEHPADLGGRYSVLSAVGMAPALAKGIDCTTLLESADYAFSQMLDSNIPAREKQSVIGAVNQAYAYKNEGISQTILMP
ncbi:MAG: hypothetical protein R3261_11420, partial [Alphaproteobacteria bacterium]|nr:hypothetical protein [Alphaproteobacteria bacterium]